jgi:hypothetical protein
LTYSYSIPRGQPARSFTDRPFFSSLVVTDRSLPRRLSVQLVVCVRSSIFSMGIQYRFSRLQVSGHGKVSAYREGVSFLGWLAFIVGVERCVVDRENMLAPDRPTSPRADGLCTVFYAQAIYVSHVSTSQSVGRLASASAVATPGWAKKSPRSPTRTLTRAAGCWLLGRHDWQCEPLGDCWPRRQKHPPDPQLGGLGSSSSSSSFSCAIIVIIIMVRTICPLASA